MSVSLIPGIYSSYEIRSSVAGGRRAGLIGLAASCTTDAAEPVEIRSYSAAVSAFGADSNMAKLIKILFLNGASTVLAAPSDGFNYASAFNALMSDSRVQYMLCDSRDQTLHASMKNRVMSADEAAKYRICVVEEDGTAATLVSRAAALNCERVVLCGNREPVGNSTPGAVAAALAAVMASGADPAIPLNGASLKGLRGLAMSFTEAETEQLIAGGVTPIESDAGEYCVVRGVTTRTTTDGEPDTSWREVNTVLIIDDVIPTIRSSLKKNFARSKNNARGRGAIRTQVVIELEDKLRKEIIESYGDVRVEADAEDPTLCIVSFGFTVAHGLSSISLEACITV